MSWSISILGKPEKVVEAIEEHSSTLNGQCKLEFDDAKPHLVGLVRQNFGQHEGLLIDLVASGSGSADRDGKQVQRSCTVKIEASWRKLAV